MDFSQSILKNQLRALDYHLKMPGGQCCTWDFTYFIPEEFKVDHIPNLVEIWSESLSKIAKKWCFQVEKTPKTGRLHFQGRLSLKVKKYPGWWSEMWEWNTTHWSPTSKANWRNDFYVTKEETRVLGPFRDDDEKPFIQAEIAKAMLNPYPWQASIIEKIKTREERIVNVLCSPEGNQGRSTFVGMLDQHGLAMEVDLDSRSTPKDLMRQIMTFKKKETYIFDLPRSYPINEPTFWEAIEKIKKGKAWDDRYRNQKEWFPIPNVWIFSNEFPDIKHLSIDRWRFWRIEDGELIQVYPRAKARKLNTESTKKAPTD